MATVAWTDCLFLGGLEGWWLKVTLWVLEREHQREGALIWEAAGAQQGDRPTRRTGEGRSIPESGECTALWWCQKATHLSKVATQEEYMAMKYRSSVTWHELEVVPVHLWFSLIAAKHQERSNNHCRWNSTTVVGNRKWAGIHAGDAGQWPPPAPASWRGFLSQPQAEGYTRYLVKGIWLALGHSRQGDHPCSYPACVYLTHNTHTTPRKPGNPSVHGFGLCTWGNADDIKPSGQQREHPKHLGKGRTKPRPPPVHTLAIITAGYIAVGTLFNIFIMWKGLWTILWNILLPNFRNHHHKRWRLLHVFKLNSSFSQLDSPQPCSALCHEQATNRLWPLNFGFCFYTAFEGSLVPFGMSENSSREIRPLERS